jgi:hypothetical protein
MKSSDKGHADGAEGGWMYEFDTENGIISFIT